MSSHQKLSALTWAREHFPLVARVAVVPPGEGLEDIDEIIWVSQDPCPDNEEDTPWFHVSNLIPYDSPGTLVLTYAFYNHDSVRNAIRLGIQGSFSRTDLSLILSTLTSGNDGSFFPTELGLPDLRLHPDTHDKDMAHMLEVISWDNMACAVEITWPGLRLALWTKQERGRR